MAAPTSRYTAVAIVLHWAIAFAILLNLPLGLWMHEHAEHNDVTEGVFRAFQLHKSIGLTVLLLSLARLAWRLGHRPPVLPEGMAAWERIVSKATHALFYVLIIAVPLTGWLYVSTGWSAHTDQPLAVPTRFFGLFHVPDLFALSHADAHTRAAAAHAALPAHGLLSWATLALAALHVGAALKHQLVDRDAVLAHMAPWVKLPGGEPEAKNPVRLAITGGGLGLTALLGALALYTVFTLPGGAPPPQAASTFETVATATATTTATATSEVIAAPATTTAAASAPAVSAWNVNTAQSSIGFSFVYADPEAGDTTFNGRFSRWRADIRFDPNDLAGSHATVTIETASASDGVAIHDSNLAAPEWFDAAGHPAATFRTTAIHRSGDGYEAQGQLTIKGHAKAVTLPFTLSIDGDRATMSGQLAIDRADFDIGARSDADSMISRRVNITLRVVATRAP